MKNNDSKSLSPAQIIDYIYEIALDPEMLNAFIEKWNESGFDVSKVRLTIDKIDAFDKTFAKHLMRADIFLERAETTNPSAISRALAPFENSAAVVVDHKLRVLALNAGAEKVLGIQKGAHVRDLGFAPEQISALIGALSHDMWKESSRTRLLNLTNLLIFTQN